MMTPEEAELFLETPVYLGDGVTVSYENGMLWLSTPRFGEVHRIALEGGVLACFLIYIREFLQAAHAVNGKEYGHAPH